MTTRILASSFTALAGLVLTFAAQAADPFWMAGFWTATSDEDKSPPDVMEFRKDGTWANYGHKCSRYSEAPFHVHQGEIFVRLEHPKGPLAIIFHPNSNKTRLTYTSPRTRNNAVYERLAKSPCNRG